MAPVHDPDRVLAALAQAQARAASRHQLRVLAAYTDVPASMVAWCMGDRRARPAASLASLERTGHARGSYARATAMGYRITDAGWARLCSLAGVQP